MTKRKLQNKILKMIDNFICNDSSVNNMTVDNIVSVLKRFNLILKLKKGRKKRL